MKKALCTLMLCVSAHFFTSGSELLTYFDKRERNKEEAEKLTRIDKWSFAYNDLKTVQIPPGIIVIGEGAFANNDLAELTLPQSTQSIEGWAFAYNKISRIIFPKDVVYIGGSAFYGNRLIDITLGDFVHISPDAIDSAFYECYNKENRAGGRYILENGTWKKQ
jgi:hypothetical protein